MPERARLLVKALVGKNATDAGASGIDEETEDMKLEAENQRNLSVRYRRLPMPVKCSSSEDRGRIISQDNPR